MKIINILFIRALLIGVFAILVYFISGFYQIDFDLNDNISHFSADKNYSFSNIINEIRPIVKELVQQKYFRYFRVDISKECEVFDEPSICTSKSKCQLRSLTGAPIEIPNAWIKEDYKKKEKDKFSPLISFDVVKPQKTVKNSWAIDSITEKSLYIDLLRDKEMFTGYQGQDIWRRVYEDNCYILSKKCGRNDFMSKVVSGMHTSVSSHLSEYCIDLEKTEPKIFPNIDMYFRQVGEHKVRMENLIFSVQVLLRALLASVHKLQLFKIETDDLKDDLKTSSLLSLLLNKFYDFKQDNFNSKNIFIDNISIEDQKALYLEYFSNIFKLMDCVDCQKCRVYGKMQLLGLGFALRQLIDYKNENIDRNELVAFINTLNKWTESIEIIEKMKRRILIFKIQIIISVMFVLFLAERSFNYFLKRLNSGDFAKVKHLKI